MSADPSAAAPTTRLRPRLRTSRSKGPSPAAAQRAAPMRNGKQANAAAELERKLQADLEANFHVVPLREILMEAISKVHAVATRDRKADWAAVERAIFVGGCRTKSEVIEETRLSEWAVRGVLDEMVMKDWVEIREKFYLDGVPEGEREHEYHPLYPAK